MSFLNYLNSEKGAAEFQLFTQGKLASMYSAKGRTFDPTTPEAQKALKQINLGAKIAAEFLEYKRNERTNGN